MGRTVKYYLQDCVNISTKPAVPAGWLQWQNSFQTHVRVLLTYLYAWGRTMATLRLA